MKRRTIRWLSILLALVMVPAITAAWRAAPDILFAAGYALEETEYRKEDGSIGKASAEPVNFSSGNILGVSNTTSWYVVNTDVTCTSRVEVFGQINLILADGCTLEIPRGIHVVSNATFTIYGQSNLPEEAGKLIAGSAADLNYAGIGGDSNDPGGRYGMINIYGGTVTATGGMRGAGIGGGNGQDSSKVTISGSARVEATGGGEAAGIGGGYGGNSGGESGKITISGSAHVKATGGTNAAGIGGGSGGSGSDITISGSAVVESAKGGASGAGIGGGYGGDGSIITINGGTVEATGDDAAGIGGGSGGSGDHITIYDGTVTATGGVGGAGIGGGYGYVGSGGGNGSDIKILGGRVMATGHDGAGIGGGSGGIGERITISGDAYVEAKSIMPPGDRAEAGNGAGIGGGIGGSASSITISGGVTIASSNTAAIGIAPDFGSFIHLTYGSFESAASTDVVESSEKPLDNWGGLRWVKIQPAVTVEFGSSGGGGTMPRDIVCPGSYLLPRCGFTAPPGKEFDRWDKGAPGDTIRITSNTTLTARWKDIEAVPAAPAVTTAALPAGRVGTAYDQTLAATGDVPITWSLDSGTLPPGLVLGIDGRITGTPAANGTYTFTVRASNAADSAARTLTITIVAESAAAYIVTFDANGGTGTMADETVNAGPYTLPPCGFTAPSGKEFDRWDKGTPGDTITITSNITLMARWKDIEAVPAVPAVTTAALPAGRVGTVYDQILAATGGAPITWSLDGGTLPTGLTLGTDGRITGTPMSVGTYTFTVRASNAAGSAARTLTVAIVAESAAAYIITFDANGGTAEPASGMTGADGTLAVLPTPTRSGYTFDGWYTAAAGGTPVTIYTVFTADATIYAHWTVQNVNDNPSDDPSDDPDDDPFYYPGYDPSDSFSGNSTGSSNNGSSGSSSGSNTKVPGTTANNSTSDTGITSPIQHAVKEDTYGDWIERVDLPVYAQSLYETLTAGSDEEGLTKYLIKDDYFTIDPNADKAYKGKIAPVAAARTLTTEETALFAGGNGGNVFNTNQFTDEYNKVDVTQGDTRIDYAALSAGDVAKNSTFNGIFVTKIPYDAATFETQRTEVCAYITTSYQAFDRDHPEIFWLSGKSKIRMLTATVDYSGTRKQEVFFFFVLADNEGFSLRSNEYQAPGAVDAGIAQREAAVQAILATVDTSADRHSQVKELNKWLTEHNAYNSSADLTTIGNNPHECLVALTGTVGTTGPVCDGYSRAFKVLCDRLGIPCVLADGYAKSGTNGAGEAHMWNNVQMNDGNWYGVDVTWNDPLVAGQASVAVSGYENENYLLVGKDTEIRGLTFGVSHPETDRVAAGGVSFANGSYLSPVAYAANTVLPFADVAADAYYYDAVAWAYGNGVTEGMSSTEFGPRTAVTRGQAMTFLWRAAGKPAPGSASNPFADVPAGEYYADAVRWAVEQGITVGTSDTTFSPAASVKNAEMLAFLARAMGTAVTGDSWQQTAIDWGIENGPLTGVSSVPEAEGFCPRSNVVFFIWRVYRGK